MQAPPRDMQLIGAEVAVIWVDGREDYFAGDFLRAHSPSAENVGERDILGNQYGGNGPREFSGVKVEGWSYTGNYAVAFHFSDGHRSGIYSWKYLRELGDALLAD